MPTLPFFNPKTQVNESPHVVILGAGASLASFPNGDKNGKILPLMNNFMKTIGLNDILDEAGIKYKKSNFENVYNRLIRTNGFDEQIRIINNRIYDYFFWMIIPDQLTIYDRLLLSLRRKDLIATFNWDPLLYQAYRRNYQIAELPKIVFLHGNVAVGICEKDKEAGYILARCSKCNGYFERCRLLYPIREKNYQTDLYIKDEWNILRNYLGDAYMVTIFGYSAPKTDVAAMELMRAVWNTNETKELAQIEIIDIRPKDEVYASWSEFIVRRHYRITNSFSESYISEYPRRTCDSFAMLTLQGVPIEYNNLPENITINGLHEWLIPLVLEEEQNEKHGSNYSLKSCSAFK
jgi:hypothetical protein